MDWLCYVGGILLFLAIFLMLSSHTPGGGHICSRCGRLTYANDDECGWCADEES
jgi:hypothetical protein